MAGSRTKRKRRAAVVIRPFEPDDVAELAPIFRQQSVVAGTLQLPHQSSAELRERWSGNKGGMRVLVAEVAGKVVGMGSVKRSERLRTPHVGDIGIAVGEQAQARGVGGALVNALVELAEKWMGLLRLELTVWVDNRAAIALYSSRGFQVEGVARAFALRDGVVVDAFHMARVSPKLPWERVTAEDVAKRTPPQLTSGFDPSAN